MLELDALLVGGAWREAARGARFRVAAQVSCARTPRRECAAILECADRLVGERREQLGW